MRPVSLVCYHEPTLEAFSLSFLAGHQEGEEEYCYVKTAGNYNSQVVLFPGPVINTVEEGWGGTSEKADFQVQ